MSLGPRASSASGTPKASRRTLVLAFRGTEKKVSDWLTDARCVPAVQGEARVHTGFLEAFTAARDDTGRNVKEVVENILARPDARDGAGGPLPLFITGHSLGGALALLATRLVAPDVNGACYTFGAPRVGNYEYFRFVRTPVYRVVNSADVVPRVPPGAFMTVFCGFARALSWLFNFIPGAASLFDRLETFLDSLHGYRHYGDLRYLSRRGRGQVPGRAPAVEPAGRGPGRLGVQADGNEPRRAAEEPQHAHLPPQAVARRE